MGFFYSQKPVGVDHVSAALQEAVQAAPIADPVALAADVQKRATQLTSDLSGGAVTLMVGRVVVAVGIAAALIIGSVVLAFMVDSQAINEAGKMAQNAAYKSPDLSGLKSAAEWLRTLGAAWSAGLVAILLSEKSSGGQ